jgi:hypothetical protein
MFLSGHSDGSAPTAPVRLPESLLELSSMKAPSAVPLFALFFVHYRTPQTRLDVRKLIEILVLVLETIDVKRSVQLLLVVDIGFRK